MRLGINGWRVAGQRTGIGRYILNVVGHWTPDRVGGRFDEIRFYTPSPLDRADVPLPDNVRERVLPPAWSMLVWENLRFGPVADDDVLFCPSYTRPLVARGRTVVTIFEATLHLFPQFYPRTARIVHDRLYGWSARHATLVVTGTEAARQDIARSYGVPASRIRVVPLAPASMFRRLPADDALRAAQLRHVGEPAPYFLYVGKLTARRNVPRLIEAFGEVRRAGALPHRLVIVGKNTTGLDIPRLAAQAGVAADVVHRDFVPDDELVALYNGADAFVLPYAYESGFSLTAIEAQATGIPVITVDTPGLRESTGDAAYYIPEAEVPEIAAAMLRLAREPSLREELGERGLEHARRLTWERCSADTLSVIEEAAGMPARAASPVLEGQP